MALSHVFVFFLAVATFVPVINISAKEFIVGDESGWTVGFDYQAWAKGKDFHAGDKLVFQYPVGVHNVHKVNGTGFQNCEVLPANEALSSGNDTIVLATPGRKWYICGVGKHCEFGQKLVITVLPQAEAPSPSMAPAPAPSPVCAMAYSSSKKEKRPFMISFHRV